jgi:predicted phage tail protein
MQGFSHEEALDLVREMFLERAATVRANGVKKILTGIGLVAVPIVALIIFLIIGVTPLKIFAVTIMVGLWGLWMLLNGIIMFLAPKSERGDLADQ